jgi:hypothetical protein
MEGPRLKPVWDRHLDVGLKPHASTGKSETLNICVEQGLDVPVVASLHSGSENLTIENPPLKQWAKGKPGLAALGRKAN